MASIIDSENIQLVADTNVASPKIARTPSKALADISSNSPGRVSAIKKTVSGLVSTPSKLLVSPEKMSAEIADRVIKCLSPPQTPTKSLLASPSTTSKKFGEQVVMRDMKQDTFYKIDCPDSPFLGSPTKNKKNKTSRPSDLESPKITGTKRSAFSIFSPTRPESPAKRPRTDLSSPYNRKNSSLSSSSSSSSSSSDFALSPRRLFTRSVSIVDKVRLFYTRTSDESSKKLQKFITQNKVAIASQRQATGFSRIGPTEALEWVQSVKTLMVIKSKHIDQIEINPEAMPSDEQLYNLILDDAGFLRVPSVIVGDVMVIGFEDRCMREAVFFGNSTANLKIKTIKPKIKAVTQD